MAKPAGAHLSESVWRALACPRCRVELEPSESGAHCPSCRAGYPALPSGSLDLRLRRSMTRTLEFPVGGPYLDEDAIDCRPLAMNPKPEFDPGSLNVPRHLTREMISWFPRARPGGSLALDLGCGDTLHREVCEAAGYEYVGLDYASRRAPILGDAHALPFRDGAFSFILSVAVLEHVAWPFLMMREAHRVMRFGGTLIGTVAFLEPFHENSHYHHTHLGTVNSLRYGGFRIERVAPSEEWSVLIAQAGMGLFPKLPGPVAKALVYPLEGLQRLLWSCGGLLRPDPRRRSRTRNTTGAFAFIARKEGVSPSGP